ncbi:MAG: DHH family phosphoesterase [Colwellia sp.]
MHYDVFNGDADGITALLQIYFSENINVNALQPSNGLLPKRKLITGVKRDISLLRQVDVTIATSVTVLDISMEKNIAPLSALLERKVPVLYSDHHRTGDIPSSSFLTTLIDTQPNTCTSLLVNQTLKGAYHLWAITGAFGDNMFASASALADEVGLSKGQQEQLKKLGTYINYNGYGQDVSDLHFHPKTLFEKLLQYPNPFDLISESGSLYEQLENAYLSDMTKASSAKVIEDNEIFSIYLLPNAAWSKRVSGVFGNDLANKNPDKAHVVLTLNTSLADSAESSAQKQVKKEESYTLSLRAPLNNKQYASDVCAAFETGGGRAAAAGVNVLPISELDRFIKLMHQFYSSSDCSSAHKTALL